GQDQHQDHGKQKAQHDLPLVEIYLEEGQGKEQQAEPNAPVPGFFHPQHLRQGPQPLGIPLKVPDLKGNDQDQDQQEPLQEEDPEIPIQGPMGVKGREQDGEARPDQGHDMDLQPGQAPEIPGLGQKGYGIQRGQQPKDPGGPPDLGIELHQKEQGKAKGYKTEGLYDLLIGIGNDQILIGLHPIFDKI